MTTKAHRRSLAGFIGEHGGVPAAPENTGVPTISGTPTNGSTLTASPGTWTGRPAPAFSYQWNRAGTPVAGATGTTYALTAADVGSAITVTVTGTNWNAHNGSRSASATSAATAAVT